MSERTQRKGFVDRRQKDTNLDYLARLQKEQDVTLYITPMIPTAFTLTEKALLMILVVRDKIYSRDYLGALRIKEHEIQTFLGKTGMLVEEVLCGSHETRNISTRKLVHNSRMMLLDIIHTFDREDVIGAIQRIVYAFRRGVYDQRRIYKDVMKFDNLNQLFGSASGAGTLIFDVYKELQELMADDLHYWLQRSKSIYHLKPNNPMALEEAYRYAKKAYLDAGQDRLKKQAALSISLICCLRAGMEMEDAKRLSLEKEAVSKCYEAMFSNYYRQEPFMKKTLRDGRKNYVAAIIEACDDVMEAAGEDADVRSYDQAAQIKEKMYRLDRCQERDH